MAQNTAKIDRTKKADNFLGTLLRLVKYMGKVKWQLLVVFLSSIGAIILTAVAPALLGLATSEVYRGIQEGMDLRAAGQAVETLPINFNYIGQIVIALIVVFALQGILRYLQNYYLARVSQDTVYNMRRDLKLKMKTLPIEFFDTHGSGDIVSRAVNDMDQISNALQPSILQLMNGVVMFVVVLIIMFSVNTTLAWVVFITAPISAILIGIVAPKSQREFQKQQKELGDLTDQVEEKFSGHTIVKTYNQEEKEIEDFKVTSAKLNDSSLKAQFLSGIMMPLVSFSRDIGYFGVAIVGGFGVLNGTIPLGVVQAFTQYVNMFSQPMRFIAQLLNTIQVTIASTERVFEIIDEEPMQDIESGVEPKKDTPYKVEFDHVQFGYGDSLLMTDFNLQVKPGEMIAVVGPTGAGKSTLINLLERFYDVNGGSIRFDGVDIRDIPRPELREKFSMVLQSTWLFNGTIWDNIAYGHPENGKDPDKIHQAAKDARVDEFVRELPNGYQTVINEEGSNISQGQRQLITIARALLADPEVLILDEATSSVDTRTEALIQEAMDKALEGRTSFVVAHRLSTIQDADKIIVMNKGDVMETGNHQELLELDGFYANLYNAQFATID